MSITARICRLLPIEDVVSTIELVDRFDPSVDGTLGERVEWKADDDDDNEVNDAKDARSSRPLIPIMALRAALTDF